MVTWQILDASGGDGEIETALGVMVSTETALTVYTPGGSFLPIFTIRTLMSPGATADLPTGCAAPPAEVSATPVKRGPLR